MFRPVTNPLPKAYVAGNDSSDVWCAGSLGAIKRSVSALTSELDPGSDTGPRCELDQVRPVDTAITSIRGEKGFNSKSSMANGTTLIESSTLKFPAILSAIDAGVLVIR